MNHPLRVLQVEDSENDAALILRHLKRAGYVASSVRVDTAGDLQLALESCEWDVVIADYHLPQFNASDALAVLQASGRDYPFIVVSGTIGEAVAVEMMRQGAHDYLMKDNLTRLAPAVERELRDAESRRARHRAEEAQREVERRLRMALEISNTGVWEWELRSGEVYWSPECYRLLGCREFDGRIETFQKMIHPEDLPRVVARGEQAIADRAMWNEDFRIVSPDGAVTWVTSLGQCCYDDKGAPSKMAGTVTNITERKRSEQDLRESRMMLESVVDSALDAVMVMDGEGTVVIWNGAAERVFGYSRREAAGRRLHDLVLPEKYSDVFERGFERFLRTGAGPVLGRTMELRAQRKDRTMFPIELSVAPVLGLAARWSVGVVRDITARKAAEAALRESDQRWQFALEGAGDGVWDWSAETDRTFYSRQYKAILGYEESEIGDDPKEWTDRLHLEDRDRVLAEMALHVEGHGTMYASEFRLRCKDGTYKWILGRGRVVERDERGQPRRIIGTHTDITSRKEAEAERDRLQEQFLQAQKMESVGRLAGGIAHDFNNLLTVINGWSGIILRGMPTTDTSFDAVTEINQAGERAAALVKQLLAFSRKEVMKREVVGVNQVISNLTKTMLGLVGADIEIRTHFHPGSASVFADRGQIEQILVNLVVNARDAMPNGGLLTIATEVGQAPRRERPNGAQPDGSYVRIVVGDTGIGMDEHTKRHLFDPFFTTKETGKGTGLGLSVVDGVVAANGGFVEFDTQLGRGTEFRIYLPEAEMATPLKPDLTNGRIEGRERILLVEDEPDVRRFILQVLTGYGYQVIETSSAADAMAALGRAKVDMLVTDITMPRTNGLELAAKATELRPNLKVLFISGHSGSVLRQVEAGATNFLSKPFTPVGLAAKIREILDTEPKPQTVRVLVVDDEPSIRRFVRNVLEGEGYSVNEAEDGRSGLDKVRELPPDLVITDLVMPDQEGLETIQQLHSEFPGVKIIAMSGAAGGRYLAMAEPLGATLTIQKPISPSALLEHVRAVVGAPGRNGGAPARPAATGRQPEAAR